jgi:TrpR-related protein YerC/YecD
MDWNSAKNKELVEAILSLKDAKEARRFLRDLMTESEIEEFGKRLCAARMLTEGASYSAIEKETKLSSTTIARVSKWLKGKDGGYRAILARLHHRPPLARED